ncbi:MAG: hypothetical protein HY420_03345 [Candidatus Kerfeldbacteria bacterium]|nr:hypothetical protein [Candidatus Kerfeldbacteria bacterium]
MKKGRSALRQATVCPFYVLAVDLDEGPESVVIVNCRRAVEVGELLRYEDVLEVDGFVPSRNGWPKRMEVQTSDFRDGSAGLIGIIDQLDRFVGGGKTWPGEFGDAKGSLVAAIFSAGIRFSRKSAEAA